MRRRIPLNFFSVPFGLTGLAEVWLVAAKHVRMSTLVGDALMALSALVWLVVLVAYLSYAASERAFRTDLLDPILSPFASLAVITPILLASLGLVPHTFTVGRILVDVFIGLTILTGAWFTGQWIYGPLELDKLHPGYFLPTVAGGLIASAGAAEVGQTRLAQIMLGYGLICYFILASMILARLFFRPFLPIPLIPTIAIEVAPAAVGSIAYFAINGGAVDSFAAFVGGYGMLMVLAQIRLLPAYLRLKFAPSFWAFAFSWAAVATTGIIWVNAKRPHPTYTWLLVGAITLLVGAIAVRTVVALLRRELLPVPAKT